MESILLCHKASAAEIPALKPAADPLVLSAELRNKRQSSSGANSPPAPKLSKISSDEDNIAEDDDEEEEIDVDDPAGKEAVKAEVKEDNSSGGHTVNSFLKFSIQNILQQHAQSSALVHQQKRAAAGMPLW